MMKTDYPGNRNFITKQEKRYAYYVSMTANPALSVGRLPWIKLVGSRSVYIVQYLLVKS